MATAIPDTGHGTDFSVNRLILLPLLGSILLLPVVLALYVFYEEQDHWRSRILSPIQLLQSQFPFHVHKQAAIMQANLAVMTHVENLARAFLARDRAALLQASQPLLQELRDKCQFTHLYFHDLNGVNFLRVHQPSRHGDLIDRHTLRLAIKTGKTSHGLELGPLGTMTLRVVTPWYDRGDLIGYLEMGKEVSHIVSNLETQMGVLLYTFIHKKYLEYTLWREGMTALEIDSQWDPFDEVVLMTPGMTIPGLADYIQSNAWQHPQAAQTIRHGVTGQARNYSFFAIPLQEVAGQTVGHLVGVSEHSAFDASLRSSLTLFSLAILLSAVVVMLLFRILQRIENRVRQEARALQDSEERLAIAQSIANLGSWDWDLTRDTLHWSPAVYLIFGLQPQEFTGTFQAFLERVHPLDRPALLQAMQEAVEQPQTTYRVDHRVLRRDGEERYVQGHGQVFRDPAGKAVRMVCTIQDITQSKEDEKAILRAMQSRLAISALLETGLESMPLARQAEVALDIILTVTWLELEFKGAFFRFDETTGELVCVVHRNLPAPIVEACHRVPLGRCLCGQAASLRQLVFASSVTEDHTIRFPGMGDHGHYCLPILSQERLLGVLNLYLKSHHTRTLEGDAFMTTVGYTLASIIERRIFEEKLAEAEATLRQNAHFDPLTGLPNRILFQEMLKQNVQHAERQGNPLGLLFVDLDHFKEVNDTYGHEAGDLVLQDAAERMRLCVRGGDVVCRLGGDEFLVLLPDLHHADMAGRIASRIVGALQAPFCPNGQVCTMGSSIGIAIFPHHAQNADDLIRYADLAMYQVKRQGRNNWRYFHSQDAHAGMNGLATKADSQNVVLLQDGL